MELKVDVAIIGAGTAGLDAMSQVREVTDRFVLIDGGPLGTTCARVGCMPSKVLIQIADDYHRRHILAREGIGGAENLDLDFRKALDYLRSLRDNFAGSVVEELIRPLGEKFIPEFAEFIEPTLLRVGDRKIRAQKIVVAAGSKPVIPQNWLRFKDRILTTDLLFEQRQLPKDMAVIGLGAIGLELGQALARMGLAITGFDVLNQIGGLQDPEVNRIALEMIGQEMPMHLGSPAEIEEGGGRLRITSGGKSVSVDKVLLSAGRRPNVEGLQLQRLGLPLDDRGLPPFDRKTLQIGDLPVFIAGDIDAYRPVLHEASHEGLVAGYNACHEPVVGFRRRAPVLIAFSDPNICIVGASWKEVKDRALAVGSARFAGGRLKIMQREGGVVRIYAEPQTGRLLGAEMAAPGGEHLAHLLAWSIQQQRTVFDLLSMPYYHPVLEETIEVALSDLAVEVETDRGPLSGFEKDEKGGRQ